MTIARLKFLLREAVQNADPKIVAREAVWSRSVDEIGRRTVKWNGQLIGYMFVSSQAVTRGGRTTFPDVFCVRAPRDPHDWSKCFASEASARLYLARRWCAGQTGERDEDRRWSPQMPHRRSSGRLA